MPTNRMDVNIKKALVEIAGLPSTDDVNQQHLSVVRLLLARGKRLMLTDDGTSNVRALEHALVIAARYGHVELGRLILNYSESTLPDDDGFYLAVYVRETDHDETEEEESETEEEEKDPALNWPRANFKDGKALVVASGYGHAAMVELLLDCPRDAPRADCQSGSAVFKACMEYRVDVLMVLRRYWPAKKGLEKSLIEKITAAWAESNDRFDIAILQGPRSETQDFIQEWYLEKHRVVLKYAPMELLPDDEAEFYAIFKYDR